MKTLPRADARISWRQRDGAYILVRDMTIMHIINTLSMVVRNVKQILPDLGPHEQAQVMLQGDEGETYINMYRELRWKLAEVGVTELPSSVILNTELLSFVDADA